MYRILSDKHKALQKAHCRLKKKCVEEERKRVTAENELKNAKISKPEKDTTEQMRHLQEKENRLLTEVQELREQNELLEFRLLELEYYNSNSKVRIAGCVLKYFNAIACSSTGILRDGVSSMVQHSKQNDTFLT